jgi:glucokinase
MQDHIIGIDIGGTMIKGAFFDSHGALVEKRSVETRVDRGRDAVLQNLIALIKSLHTAKGQVLSVGIGVAGVLDPPKEVLLESPNIKPLEQAPLKKLLNEALQLPVFLENDANAAALGEQWAGAGRELDNFLCITLGTGIGGGFILHGDLWTGENGKAGEIGHMVVATDGILCACGKRGCLEAYSSATAIKRMAQDAVQAGACSSLQNLSRGDFSAIDAEMVHQAALQGDAISLDIFKQMARYLAIGISNVNNLLDIHTFIIGGAASNALEVFRSFLLDEVARQVYAISQSKIKITASQLGNDAGIYGAAYLALKSVKPPDR